MTPYRVLSIPTDITFTPTLFTAIDVSEDVQLRAAVVEWETNSAKAGLDTPGMDKLDSESPGVLCVSVSASYQTELKSRWNKTCPCAS